LRVNLSAIRAAAALMMRHSHTLRETLRGNPEAVLTVVDNYWKGVAQTFPDAWADKTKYILLQSIGLNGFAEFGGAVIDRAGDNVQADDFAHVLDTIKPKISLERAAHPGIAGAGGATQVAQMLHDAYTEENLIRAKILKVVGDSPPSPDDRIASLAAEKGGREVVGGQASPDTSPEPPG
jgi:hypothetical protein